MFSSQRRWFALIVLNISCVAGLLPEVRAADPPRLFPQALAEKAPSPWAGIFATVVTPFRGSCGGIDTVSLQKQIERELRGGVHGLVVLDTLGEGAYVNLNEREQVVATAVRLAFPKVPIVVGIHSCDGVEARAQILQARKLGASAVLVKCQGGSGARAEDVYRFYAELAGLRALPIFYDHCPGQTGLTLSAGDVAAILSLPGIVGIKESILDRDEMEEHMRLSRGLGKAFFSSSAQNLTQFLDLGVQGAMCPEAVLLPAAIVQAYDAHLRGRCDEARSIQEQMDAVLPIVRATPSLLTRVAYLAQDMKMTAPSACEQSPAQMKAALTCLGVPTPAWVKCPLPELTVWNQRCVRSAVGKLREIDGCDCYRRVPPIPYRTCPEPAGGALLKTGAFQLGSGVGKDLLRSQGDGLQGFPVE